MGNRSNYVRTGNSWLTGLANKLSLLPFIGSFIAAGVGSVAVIWDSAKWLIRGKPLSAATELATGMVGHGLNAVSLLDPNNLVGTAGKSLLWWTGAVGVAGVSGHTIGTHGRKLAEELIGGVTGALGIKPTVLKSYPAGIGAMQGAANYYAQMGAPGYWTTRAAQQQGLDPQMRYQQYASGAGREHVEALRNAQAMGGAQYRA